MVDADHEPVSWEKVYIFVSSKPRSDSDVDLLVVMPFEGSPFRLAAVILGYVVRTIGVLPMDLLVRPLAGAREGADGRQVHSRYHRAREGDV